jgi:hypothetical protein
MKTVRYEDKRGATAELKQRERKLGERMQMPRETRSTISSPTRNGPTADLLRPGRNRPNSGELLVVSEFSQRKTSARPCDFIFHACGP